MDPERDDYADLDLPPPRSVPRWVMETVVGIAAFLAVVLFALFFLSPVADR